MKAVNKPMASDRFISSVESMRRNGVTGRLRASTPINKSATLVFKKFVSSRSESKIRNSEKKVA